MSVSTVPKARKMSSEPKPWADHDCTNASTSGVSPRLGTDSFMNDKPRNKRQKPTMSSLILRRWLRFELESRKPTAMSGTARMEMLTDNTIFPPTPPLYLIWIDQPRTS